MTRLRCAILDDYFNMALSVADWSAIGDRVDVTTFDQPFASEAAAAGALRDFEIICAMRERTAFPRKLFDALPNLKLLITSGMRNAAIDTDAAKERNVVICGTQYSQDPTAPLTMGLILELTRGIGRENARMHAGEPWQTFAGVEIEGKTLGVIGLGKLGGRIANLGKAFGMNVIAWSPNLTAEKCKEAGVGYATKEELFAQADIVTIHVVLSERSRGLVGASDLARMKPTAYLVNTSRGPIVDEQALLEALQQNKIAGAGIDVFSVEPLPVDHPFRKLDNMVLTPHLGYATLDGLRTHYGQMVAAIRRLAQGASRCEGWCRIVRPTRTKLFEQAVATVRGLPAEMQDELARTLLQLAGQDQPTLQLSPEEVSSFQESLAQADRGEFAIDEQVRAIWAKHSL